MKNEMQVFESEEFGKLGVVSVDGKQYFPASNCAKILGYTNASKAINDHCRSVTKRYIPHPQNPSKEMQINFIPEGDLYRLIVRSKLPSAEKFETWVFDEVLPIIRKTGGFVANEDLFINTYLPNADEQTKILFKTNLVAVRELNEKVAKQEVIINSQKKEIDYKDEVLKGVTEDIDIYTKRNVLNKVVRYKGADFQRRWQELYDRFKEVHSIDLPARRKGYNLKQEKKKDQLSIVKYAEKFGYLDDLYKIAVKLYATDIDAILKNLQKITA